MAVLNIANYRRETYIGNGLSHIMRLLAIFIMLQFFVHPFLAIVGGEHSRGGFELTADEIDLYRQQLFVLTRIPQVYWLILIVGIILSVLLVHRAQSGGRLRVAVITNIAAVVLFLGFVVANVLIRHTFVITHMEDRPWSGGRAFLISIDSSPLFAVFLVLVFLSTHPAWRSKGNSPSNPRGLIVSFMPMTAALLFIILCSVCRIFYLF
jgi:hypothetical protein